MTNWNRLPRRNTLMRPVRQTFRNISTDSLPMFDQGIRTHPCVFSTARSILLSHSICEMLAPEPKLWLVVGHEERKPSQSSNVSRPQPSMQIGWRRQTADELHTAAHLSNFSGPRSVISALFWYNTKIVPAGIAMGYTKTPSTPNPTSKLYCEVSQEVWKSTARKLSPPRSRHPNASNTVFDSTR
jgi:hypothetical protein